MRGLLGLLRRAPSCALIGTVVSAACVAVCLGSVEVAPAATLPSGFQESTAFSGLTNPTVVRFASDGRVFVAEKSGLIKVFDNLSDPTPTLFADLSTNVYNFWDRGLLGLALHPNFPATPYVYALYTYDAAIGGVAPRWGTPGVLADPCPAGPTTNGCLVSGRLSRLEASGNVMTGPEHVLIEDWCQQFPSHSVGSLAFGPDGALYASGGDGASFTFVDSGQNGNPCSDPSSEGGALRSQDRRTSGDPVTLDGSIVRVDPITGAALPDNPLALDPDPNARRIVASGLRNPFRITVRPGTSEVWAGDVGWNDWEELNLAANGGDATVENFGWPCYEGNGRQSGYDAANLSICENLYGQAGAVTAPYYAYNHAARVVTGETCPTGSSSLAGLAFYNGTSFPASYNGALFFADYSRDCIWVMQSGADGRPNPATVATFAAGAANPVDLAVSPGGDLFYPDFDGGTIRRIRFGSDPPPPPPPSCPTGQYSAQYYANMTLSGTPATERCEPAIDYDWGAGSPATAVPVDGFSARWTGTFSFTAGTYQFTATADDGIRVWVDGTPVIDAWVDQPPSTYQATRSLTAGDHEVKVEYYENGGGAVARVNWQLTQPPPPPPACPTGQYSAQYFGNMTLSGTPVVQRCETAIDYDWGSGSPATGVPADRFSTRWTGTFSFAAGNYQFTATADDGIRVWLDGTLLIDAWVDQGPTTYQATRTLTAADHQVKVEYYENGGGAVARVSWINTGGGGDTTPPDAPTGLGAAVSGSTANLSWNAAGDNVGVTGYNVHRSTTSGFVPSLSNRIAQPTGTSYADSGRAPGTYYYLVTAEDAAGNVGPPSNQASATIVNNPPTASIAAPSATTIWKVGDVISFSGSATDPEQGTLPASGLSWTLILHHCPSNCHTHTVQTWSGVAGGSFTAPDHDYPSHLELRLTATDSGGQSDTESVELQPQTVDLTFASEPSGLQLVVGSASQTTPFTRTVIVGSLNSISATTPQSQGGTQYGFSSWSDGGTQTHNIVAPAAPATYTATYSEVAVVPGLVAAYAFNEGSGATVVDSSGNGNHGTISGATRNSSGQYGAALDFDGTNDLVSVPDSSSLDLTSGMTVEAWVRPLTTSGWRTVVLKERPGDTVYALYSSNNDNGRPNSRIRVNGSNASVNGTSRLTTSVWTHLAATFDGSNLRLYVNGSLVGTRTAAGTILTSANPLRIGGSSALGRWFRGRIDEVRVYNRALSVTEIQSDRTTPLSQTAAARRLAGAAPEDGAPLGRSCGTLVYRCL
jgi:glucose/arabinose dehydrogenase